MDNAKLKCNELDDLIQKNPILKIIFECSSKLNQLCIDIDTEQDQSKRFELLEKYYVASKEYIKLQEDFIRDSSRKFSETCYSYYDMCKEAMEHTDIALKKLESERNTFDEMMGVLVLGAVTTPGDTIELLRQLHNDYGVSVEPSPQKTNKKVSNLKILKGGKEV